MKVRGGPALLPLLSIALALFSYTGCGGKPEAKLAASGGTASIEAPDGLFVALTVTNESAAQAEDVQVSSVSIPGATLTLPASLPFAVGSIPRGRDTTLDANFSMPSVKPETDYLVRIAGTFREHGRQFPFALQQNVRTPPGGPGSRQANSGTAPSNQVTGAPFPAQQPNFDSDVNDSAPARRIPTGPLRPLTPSNESAVHPAPAGRGGGGGTGSINFPVNASVGIQSSTVAEPSGASGGGVVFETANWYASFSTNGGGSFTQLNPTTIFPNGVDGGFCCDQIVQYVPSIDRFIWVMQYGPTTPAPNPNPKNLPSKGPGLYRVAAASPAQVKSSGGTAWTYWDITSQAILENTNNPWLDYPDVTYGDNFLYLSADDVNNAFNHVVVRMSLSDIKAGGTLNFSYTKPSDSTVAWGAHLCQNSRDQIFWAGHNTSSSIRVFNWPESSGSYSWRDINIGSWPQTSSSNLMTSKAPDGTDWLNKLSNFPNNAVLGLARSAPGEGQRRNQLYLAWTGAIGGGFKQPQVQWIALDINNNFALVSQQQVWNVSYAYAYPAFAVNSRGELGMSLEWGGGGNYENHVAGFWGDFVVYQTTNSNVGPPADNNGFQRFGDYVTIRQNTADPTKFDAFGYGILQSTPPGNPTPDVHYIVFSR
jgi:hypothetical protein